MINILLDPGHSERFSGARREPIREEIYTFSFCLQMIRLIDLITWTYSDHAKTLSKTPLCILSHSFVTNSIPNTKTKDFENRALIAKNNNIDCVVSIHLNANKDSSTLSGPEIYYRNREELEIAYRGFTKPLKIDKYFKCNNYGWTKNAYNVLKRYDCPAFLFELGYLTNDQDFKKFQNPHEQAKLRLRFAESLLNISKYLTEIKATS